MTRAQLEMATQAIAKEHGCELDGGMCPAGDKGEPCICERFARAAIRAAEKCATLESPED